MQLLIPFLLTVAAAADPLKDLAVAQRNYAIARAQMAETLVKLQAQSEQAAKTVEAAQKSAQELCAKEGKELDLQAVACKERDSKK